MNTKNTLILGSVLVVAIAFFIALKTVTVKPKNGQEYSFVSVMITRYDGRSGGSGVIISSSKNSSKILTNAHVCEVIKHGGIVRSDYTKGIVKNYKVSNIHDLCLITTNNNFKVNTLLAEDSPEIYEDAAVVGHPHLLPAIVTRGHFSQKELITILVGTRPCTDADRLNPNLDMFCGFFGLIPIVKTYEAQVVSSTIMPGSSGSPVFNSKGEIAGLVFAGSGNFGYAMVVPFEYISNFFEYELDNLPSLVPTDLITADSAESESSDWTSVCVKGVPANIKLICDLASRSLLLRN